MDYSHDIIKMNYRISVIMGIYNCAPYLQEALDSLYAQTYQNFKIILCDDGSIDDTYMIAKQYADRYDNIVLIRNKNNMKLAATLNRCLEYADTEFVARMDGDDISLPTRFEKEINFLDKHPEYSHVSCPMIYFDETGDWRVGKAVKHPTKKDFRNGAPFRHAPAMIRTKALKSVGGYTAEKRVERVEDYYMWYKMYKAGLVGANLEEPLYKMRDDKNAMRRRSFADRWRGMFVNYEVCKGLEDPLYLLVALKNFMKAFVPLWLAFKIRKSMKN